MIRNYNPSTFKTKRQALGLTLESLSDLTGICRQTISNIEKRALEKHKDSSVLLLGLVMDIYATKKGPEYVKMLKEIDNLF